MPPLIEVWVDNFDSALTAQALGADRFAAVGGRLVPGR